MILCQPRRNSVQLLARRVAPKAHRLLPVYQVKGSFFGSNWTCKKTQVDAMTFLVVIEGAVRVVDHSIGTSCRVR
jgi:hypothetical protein